MKKHELLAHAKPHYEEDRLLELESAIDYATEKHSGQKRKSGEPYIIHPLSVADILIDWGMDIDTVLAGVLHDTVEDTEGCILVGEQTNHEDKIWNCSGPDAYLLNLVKQEDQCLWVITSK